MEQERCADHPKLFPPSAKTPAKIIDAHFSMAEWRAAIMRINALNLELPAAYKALLAPSSTMTIQSNPLDTRIIEGKSATAVAVSSSSSSTNAAVAASSLFSPAIESGGMSGWQGTHGGTRILGRSRQKH